MDPATILSYSRLELVFFEKSLSLSSPFNSDACGTEGVGAFRARPAYPVPSEGAGAPAGAGTGAALLGLGVAGDERWGRPLCLPEAQGRWRRNTLSFVIWWGLFVTGFLEELFQQIGPRLSSGLHGGFPQDYIA